jgi:hypothetical protein
LISSDVIDFGSGAPNATVFVVDDLNGDGSVDLITSGSIGSTVAVWINDTLGGFSTSVSYGTGALPREAVVRLFDNNGIKDIAIVTLPPRPPFASNITLLLSNGGGTRVAP